MRRWIRTQYVGRSAVGYQLILRSEKSKGKRNSAKGAFGFSLHQRLDSLTTIGIVCVNGVRVRVSVSGVALDNASWIRY